MRHSVHRKLMASLLFLTIIIGIIPIIHISVSALSEITYTDENGLSKTANANIVSNSTATLTSGWYIVNGNVNTTNLRVSGSVNLVLADGCVLTAGASNNNAGIEMEHQNSLTIYGQVLNTGKIIATGNGRGSGIGGSGGVDGSAVVAGEVGGHCGTLTINGGIIAASRIGGGDGGKGVSGRDEYSSGGNGGNGGIIILRKGTLTISGNLGGGNGGSSDFRSGGTGGAINTLTVYGGTLTAGSICGGNGGDGRFTDQSLDDGYLYPLGIAGNGGNGGTININGGSVTVNGDPIQYLGNMGGGRAGNTSSFSKSPGKGGNGSIITVRGGTTKVARIIGGGSCSPSLNGERGSVGSCVITGGSLTAAFVLPVPTNGTENGSKAVYCTTIYLDKIVTETSVLYLFHEVAYSYGTKDLKTDSAGRIFAWLPENSSATKVYTKDNYYSGSVVAKSSGTLQEMPPDTVKPEITSLTPAKNAVNVPINGKISITFNEIMKETPRSVTITSEEGVITDLTDGSWSVNNTIYTVKYAGLAQGKKYTVSCKDFTDLAGNIIDINEDNYFTTIPPTPMFDFSYIDEIGNIKIVSTYKIDSTVNSLKSGWYAADGKINLSNMTINGEVNLILADGCDLTISGTGSNAAINVKNGNSLTIYGQALGSGILRATAAGRGAGIGGNGGVGSTFDTSSSIGQTCGTVNINGGNVFADHIGGGDGDDMVGFSAGKGGNGGKVNINGGTVSVSSRIGGGDGGDGSPLYIIGGDGGDGSALSINGGNVDITGKIGGGTAGTGSSRTFGLVAKAGTAGSCTITGGSVKAATMQPVPKNGSANGNLTLTQTIVTLSDKPADQPVTALKTNRSELYSIRDMKSDMNGSFYLWLPAGTEVNEIFTLQNYYTGSVLSSTSGTLDITPRNTEKPAILSSEPSDGGMDVMPAGSISIIFNKVMDIDEGTIILTAEGAEAIVLSGGLWSYGGTVFTVKYSDLSYSTDYSVELSGFKDITGIASDSYDFIFTTQMHPKTVIISIQNGELISTSAGIAKYMITTISIDSDEVISLNNINDISGISLETMKTAGDNTIIEIKTTELTPDGLHPLTLTIDGVSSEQFNLEVIKVMHSIELSQKDKLEFPVKEAGYETYNEHIVSITNTGNLPTGKITISLTDGSDGSFTLSTSEIQDIRVNESVSLGILPKDGLPAGTYSDTITISGDKVISQTFDVGLTISKRSGNLINKVTFPATATIKGTSIYATAENDVADLRISLEISEGASWKLYRDVACSDEIADKILFLDEGMNMAFLAVTAENGSSRLYAISIMRQEGGLLLGNPQTGDAGFPFIFLIIFIIAGTTLIFVKKINSQGGCGNEKQKSYNIFFDYCCCDNRHCYYVETIAFRQVWDVYDRLG